MITVCIGEVDLAERCDAELLPAAERRRLERLRRPVDQRRFLATWTVATRMLSSRLGIDPADVRLDRRCRRCDAADHAKPRVVGSGIELSVSHSGEVFAVALSSTNAVGIDVEREITDPWSASMAELVLAEDEPVPATGAQAQVWVRKEAVLKCVGDGLMAPPSGLRLTGVGPVPRILGWNEHPDLVQRIQLLDLPVRAGYRAAMAVWGAASEPIDVVNPPADLTSAPCGTSAVPSAGPSTLTSVG